ncbi:MAG: M20/M25/M40 family metallo-hydrolase [Firmicutes bacterium]|nr:M20/M25/M40 family metallo-hydrolase [Bacillota bacterium]
MKQLLTELTAIPGACAHEYPVISYIKERLQGKVDTMTVDTMGNLIVSKKGDQSGPNLLLCAHADEVGFYVSRIEPTGFVRFELRGGQDDRTLPLMDVVISTDNGPVKGVIGSIPAHLRRFDNQDRVNHYQSLYIDIGADSAEEARAMGVELGDPITWTTPLTQLGKDKWLGHAFDDRAGCACLIKLYEELDFSSVKGTVYSVFSVREEVGLIGAEVAARTLTDAVSVDCALAIDTTPARDTLEAGLMGMMDRGVALGKGPAIKVLDMSYAATPSVYKKLRRVAKENSIPYQDDVFMGIGTDSGAIYKAGSGVPTSGISIPSRYCHSAKEIVHERDMLQTMELLKAFVLSLEDPNEFRFQ